MFARGLIVVLVLVACFSYIPAEDVQSLIQRKSFIQVVRDEVRKYPHLVRQQLNKLSKENNNKAFETFLSTIDDEGPQVRCISCKGLIGGLRAAVGNGTWDDVRETVIDACIVLFDSLGGNNTQSEHMCVGILDLQGLHLVMVLTALPEGDEGNELMCEHLNSCIPSSTSIHGVSTRKRKSKPGKKYHPSHRNHAGRAGHAGHAGHAGLKSMKLSPHAMREGGYHPRKRYSKKTGGEHRETDSLVIAQLNDVHIDPHYAEGSANQRCGYYVCCRDFYTGEGSAAAYGEYKCNMPQRTLDLFLEKVDVIKPDYILYAGDTPPHTMWDETYHSQLNCTAILIDSLTKILPDYTVYPNIGNHEMYPTNLFSVGLNETKHMSEEFAEMWKPLAGFEQDQIDTMHKGGYYSILARENLRILSFNTNYWYSFNWYNALNSLEDSFHDMFQFMEDTLAAARENNEKVIIIGHHPPGGSDMIVTYTRRYTDMAVEYSDVIVLHVAGHTHRDEFRVATDADGAAKSVVFAAPSINTLATMNPSMRIFHLDPVTFQVRDYDQYYLDLETATRKNQPPEIIHSYSAMDEYGLDEFTPAEWLNLVKRFDADDALFQQYFYNYNGRTDENRQCIEDCKTSHVCKLSNTNYDESLDCEDNYTPTTGPTTEVPPTTTEESKAWMLAPSISVLSAALLILQLLL